jgi:hypothetical protein
MDVNERRGSWNNPFTNSWDGVALMDMNSDGDGDEPFASGPLPSPSLLRAEPAGLPNITFKTVRVAKAAAEVPEGTKKPRKTAEGGKAPPCFVEEHGICWVSTNRDGNGSRATRVCVPAGYGNVVCMSTLNSKAVLEVDQQITANLGLAEFYVVVLVIFLVFVVAVLLLLLLLSWTLPQLDHGQSLREYGASNLSPLETV